MNQAGRPRGGKKRAKRFGKSKPKEVCLACEFSVMPNNPEEAPAGVSYSRYCDAYICSKCGRQEALEGFFWSIRAKAAGVRIKNNC